MRIGHGYDVHRLVPGRKLILGGVEIPFERGLDGHSDADVLTHALMDALLGAACLGDIGLLFPDNDPQYKGISSLLLLEEVVRRVHAAGFAVGNADITVLCQRPKLRPHIPMRADEIIGGADAAHQRVGGLGIAHICAAELQRVRTQAADLCAHAVQNLQQEPDIGDIRHVFDAAGAVYEQCCRKNRHGGVFCAADGYDAGQRMAALDNVFIHVIPSHDRSICNMSQNNSANFRQRILPAETFSWKVLSTV